jgi:hypothetical protein
MCKRTLNFSSINEDVGHEFSLFAPGLEKLGERERWWGGRGFLGGGRGDWGHWGLKLYVKVVKFHKWD